MFRTLAWVPVALFLFSPVAAVADRSLAVEVAYRKGSVALNVGIYEPARGAAVAGDILYLHGFADSFVNHAALFRRWTDAGFRVIGFDYPGHGATRGTGSGASLNRYNMDDLAKLAHLVERRTREDERRKLLVAGWSTGGLLAVRLAQTAGLERKIAGAILFAPGVAVKPVVGKPSLRYPLGEVTLDTLTHESGAAGLTPITPRSPGDVPFFATSLLFTSQTAFHARYPKRLPTLILLAGNRSDKYVNNASIRGWARKLGPDVITVQCPKARHWIDREPTAYGGREAIEMAGTFAERVVRNDVKAVRYDGDYCRR